MTSFRERLERGEGRLGLWQALATPYTAEICANAGFDWLLFDGEHAPNTVATMLAQLQAVARFPCEAIARLPVSDPLYVKQYLDIGFRTLLVPMISTVEAAKALVSAARFPPDGIRGVASATSRASGFGVDRAYLRTTHQEHTLIAQIETRDGLKACAAIAGVAGIDALFVGPADLSASLGHLGDPDHPEVQSAIAECLAAGHAGGKPVGIFAVSVDDAKARLDQGFAFVSLGTDIGLLTNGARLLRNAVSDGAPA